MFNQPLAPWRPTPIHGHIGFGPRFINKNKLIGRPPSFATLPILSLLNYIFTLLLGRDKRLFL